jgi:hypothetical protein
MRRTSILGLAAMAAGLVAGGPAIALGEGSGLSPTTLKQMAKEATKPVQAERSSMRGLLGGGIGGAYSSSHYRRAKPGWTNRYVQRIARKKRNQARNRAAHRG